MNLTNFLIFSKILGYVNKIESPKLVKNDTLLVFSFNLNNHYGQSCEVVVWNHVVKKIEPLINARNVIIKKYLF